MPNSSFHYAGVNILVNNGTRVSAPYTVTALGVTSLKRSPLLPEIPAVADTVPGYDTASWFGIGVRTGVSNEIIEKIEQAAKTIALPVLVRVSAIPFSTDGSKLRVAITDPGDVRGLDELRLATRHLSIAFFGLETTAQGMPGVAALHQYVNVIAPSPANSIRGVAPLSSPFSTSSDSSRDRSLKQIGQT